MCMLVIIAPTVQCGGILCKSITCACMYMCMCVFAYYACIHVHAPHKCA